MMGLRLACAAAVLACAILPANAAGPETDPVTTGALPSVALVQTPADLPRQLRAGPVLGELTASALGTPSSPGSSTFAQLKLTGAGNAKRGIAAELMVEAEHGEIVSITGPDVDAETAGAATIARIGGLREGRPRTVLIEFKLRAADGNPPNRLKLTLRLPASGDAASAEESVAIAWPVTDCAGGFHAALKEIGTNGGNALRQSWRAAAQPDASMPRGWLFRPALPRRQSRRRSEDETGVVPAKTQREVFTEAGQLISAGYDSSLRQSGRYGWTISKVAEDLGKYFSQEPNPALCTGALGLADYYDGRLEPLRKRGERLAALAAAARLMAREKAEALFETARDLPGGHPAWGGASLAALKPASGSPEDFKALIGDLLHIGDFPRPRLAEVSAAPDAYAALRILNDIGLDAGELPEEARGDLRAAVSAIEAAIRLDAVQARQQALWQGLFGSLQAIRDAHAKHCVCGS